MKFRDFVFGALLGAAAGILLAPESGRRNRTLVRDKAVKYSHDAGDFVDKKSRHIANKAKGYAHDVKDYVSSLTTKGKEVVEEQKEMMEQEQSASM